MLAVCFLKKHKQTWADGFAQKRAPILKMRNSLIFSVPSGRKSSEDDKVNLDNKLRH